MRSTSGLSFAYLQSQKPLTSRGNEAQVSAEKPGVTELMTPGFMFVTARRPANSSTPRYRSAQHCLSAYGCYLWTESAVWSKCLVVSSVMLAGGASLEVVGAKKSP